MTLSKQQLQEALESVDTIYADTAINETRTVIVSDLEENGLNTILEAARAYAELPEKLRGMKEPETAIRIEEYTKGYGDGYNKAIDNIIKEIENE